MVALPKREMCFWYTSLEPGAQMLLRHKRRKLNTVSFHFRCVSEKNLHRLM